MFRFQKTQIFDHSLCEIFTFFETPENLEIITPDDLKFKIKTAKPLIMKKGATFSYTIKLGLIRFPWQTLITKYNPPYLFQDIQTFGPYKKWEHTHEFFELGDKTKMIDTIDYDLFPGFLNNIINNVYVKKKIEKIFNYRYAVLNNLFNKKDEQIEDIYQ